MPATRKKGPAEIHPDSWYRSGELTRFGLSYPTRWRLKQRGLVLKPVARTGGAVWFLGADIMGLLQAYAELHAAEGGDA